VAAPGQIQAHAVLTAGAWLPMRLAGVGRRDRMRRASELLYAFGVSDCAERVPERMSGGEQQRTAIATALANQPRLLLADEATGELDSETGRQIMRLLQTVVRSEGITALVATHDAGIVDLADEVLTLEDGRIGA
jgi:putative ABC transport system ATP-binding protein